jgi:hypothetical protein
VKGICFWVPKVPYSTTLAVLMSAAIIGVLTPIPAGLGLLEAVHLTLLSDTVPQSKLMAALLAYRVLYYLVPFAGGLLLYFGLESYAARGIRPQPCTVAPVPSAAEWLQAQRPGLLPSEQHHVARRRTAAGTLFA